MTSISQKRRLRVGFVFECKASHLYSLGSHKVTRSFVKSIIFIKSYGFLWYFLMMFRVGFLDKMSIC